MRSLCHSNTPLGGNSARAAAPKRRASCKAAKLCKYSRFLDYTDYVGKRSELEHSRATLKSTIAFVAVIGAAFLLTGCKQSGQTALADRHRAESIYTFDWPFKQERQDKMADVDSKMAAGDYVGAEAAVDATIADPDFDKYLFSTYMFRRKAQLLDLRGADQESLDIFMQLLAGNYGVCHLALDDFVEMFDLAMTLNGMEDADTVATAWIANEGLKFNHYEPMNPSPETLDANSRLAYVYLMRGRAVSTSNHDAYIEFCLRAKDLLPNDTVVLVETARAYTERGTDSDRQIAKDLYRTAYENEAGDPDMQAAIFADVKVEGLVPFP